MDTREEKIGEAREVLDAIGHENEKQGIKWTKYFMDKWDKREWQKNQLEQDKLRRTKKKKEYYLLVQRMLHEKIMSLERPGLGYWAETGLTEQGIWAKLHDRWGMSWVRGFKPSGIPKYDHNAVMTLVIGIEDKMWELEDDPKTDSGINLT